MRAGEVESLLALSPADRLEPLTELARSAVSNGVDDAGRGKIISALVAVLESGAGNSLARMAAGEVLGALGDPRLRSPSESDYWAEFDVDGHQIAVGKNLVSVREVTAFFDGDGYQNDEYWTEAGKYWRDTRRTLRCRRAIRATTPPRIRRKRSCGVTSK